MCLHNLSQVPGAFYYKSMRLAKILPWQTFTRAPGFLANLLLTFAYNRHQTWPEVANFFGLALSRFCAFRGQDFRKFSIECLYLNSWKPARKTLYIILSMCKYLKIMRMQLVQSMHFPRISLAYPLSFQKQESEINVVCLLSAAEMS